MTSHSKIQQLEQFIISMPVGVWFTTRNDAEIVECIKQWIDGEYLWPKYDLVFNGDYTKFKKQTLK